VVKGQRSQIEGVSTKVTENEWHQPGLRAEGPRLTIMDAASYYSPLPIAPPPAPARLRLDQGDSVTRFDGVEILTLP
jgi:hypothetical protein